MKEPEFLDKYLHNEIFKQNCYNVELGELWGQTVFDIGANRGIFSLFAVGCGAKKVIAVEAQKTIFLNHLLPNVGRLNNCSVFHYAVTNKAWQTIKLTNADAESCLYVNNETGESVSTITLEDLVFEPETNNNMALKMDIEGAEYDVLMGIKREVIRRFKTIYIEIHGTFHPVYKGSDLIHNKLESLGFDRTHKLTLMSYAYQGDPGTVDPKDVVIAKYVRIGEYNE